MKNNDRMFRTYFIQIMLIQMPVVLQSGIVVAIADNPLALGGCMSFFF